MVETKQDRAEALAVIAVRMRIAGDEFDAQVLEDIIARYIDETRREREAKLEEEEIEGV